MIGGDILLAGVDDWVHFGEVSWFVARRERSASRSDRIEEALAVIRSLPERGMIQVGDVGRAGFSSPTPSHPTPTPPRPPKPSP